MSSIALEAMLSTSMVVPSALAAITSATAGTVLPPRLVDDLDRHAPARLQHLGDDTRARIRRCAGDERHDQLDGLGGILGLGVRGLAVTAASAAPSSAVSHGSQHVASSSVWLFCRCSAFAHAVADEPGYCARAVAQPKRHSQDQHGADDERKRDGTREKDRRRALQRDRLAQRLLEQRPEQEAQHQRARAASAVAA